MPRPTGVWLLGAIAAAIAGLPSTSAAVEPMPAATSPSTLTTAAHRDSNSASWPQRRLADLDGRWRQLASPADERDRMKAIDTAVEPLTWVVRKMAGGVLRSTTAPKPELLFIWDGTRLHERVKGAHGDETRLIEPGAGTKSAIDPRGEPFEGAWLWTPEGLRFDWRQRQAYGVNVYRLDEARRELTIDHTIHVTGIDGVRPILYRSRFLKDGLPAVSAASETVPR